MTTSMSQSMIKLGFGCKAFQCQSCCSLHSRALQIPVLHFDLSLCPKNGLVDNVEIIERLGRQDQCSGLDSFMNSCMTSLFISLGPSFSATTMGGLVKQPASVYLSLWFCGFGP